MADADSIENIGNMLDNARIKFMRNLDRANMLTKMEDLPQEKAEKLFDEARNLYQKNIRDIQKFAPETFQMWQDSQEKRYVDTLNKLAFESNPDIPYDEELGDELQYLLTMPYGSEAEKGLDLSELTYGFATPKFENQKEVMVSMGTDDPETVARHEGFHELTGGEPFSVTDDSGKIKKYGTEYVARAFDYLRALVENDQELKDSTESYVKEASDNQHGPYTLLKIAIESIPQLYERGVFDKEKVALETAQEVIKKIDEDEQGFIASLLGEEPEKVKEPTRDIEDPLYLVGKLRKGDEDAKEELKKILSVLPFSKKETKDVPYKDTYSINRSEVEMNEGGLMSDPLVLSETAEEEAEPKMSVGEYAEGVKEVVEDFSPAGTAEAILETGKNLIEGEYGKAAISALGAIPGGKTAGKAAKALEVGVDTTKLTGDQLRNYASATVKMLEDTAKQTGKVAGDKGSKLYAPVEEGTKVAVRKNLNSSVGADVDPNLNTLQTLHAGTYSGKALSYMPVVTIKNAEFAIGQAGRRDIAAKQLGKESKAAKSKFPMAAVNGEYTNGPSLLEQYVPTDLVEVGFNPKYNHLFIDMQTGQAVKGAEEATIIGDRVYAKGVKYWKKSEAPEPLPTSKGEELPSDVRYREMNAGGLMSTEYNKAES